MIENIEIKNFKAFERLTLKEMTSVALVGGKNNVGKTSLLEALFMLLAKLNANPVLSQYARRGLGTTEASKEIAWAPIFHDFDPQQDIAISAELTKSVRETLHIKLKENIVPPSKQSESIREATGIKTDGGAILLDALELRYGEDERALLYMDLSKGCQLHIEHMRGPSTPVVYLDSRTRRHPTEEAQVFGNIDRIGQTHRVVELLQVIEPGLESLSLIPLGGQPIIHAKLKDFSSKVPVALTGEGMSRLLSIALALFEARGGIVLIDEIENGIHYTIQEQIWRAVARWSTELGSQVLATTHSYECLTNAHKALSAEGADLFTYFRLDQTPEGIVSKRLDHEMLGVALETGMEVR